MSNIYTTATVSWNGDTWDNYYKFEESHDVPLCALLTFHGVPVCGHRISWGFDKIFNKGEAEVKSNDPKYPTYGHMSGEISTSDSNGGATATYSLGYNFGQIVFAIDDASVYTRGSRSGTDSVASSIGAAPSNYQAAPFARATNQPLGDKRSRRTKYKGEHTGVYRFVHDSPYNDVDGRPNSEHKEAYPAPSGSEREELLPETLSKVTSILSKVSNTPVNAPKIPGGESTTGWRLQDFIGPGGERRIFQHGSWWFAQVVGDDPESFGTHLSDVKVPVPGKSTFDKYSAAFDVVLVGVPIFLQQNNPRTNGRRVEFGPYVKEMRDNGFVAWHRWAGEAPSTSENEMHCIDPATPFLKNALGNHVSSKRDRIRGQIGSFLRRGTGGGYPPEPETGLFAITVGKEGQTQQVRNRFFSPLSVPNAQADNISP